MKPRPSFAALLALLLLAGCWREPPGDVAAGRPNVLLVTIDTLRADHLGCYGHAAAATATLAAVAAGGGSFATAIADVPLTGPSHASILTGRTPLGHGFRDNGGYVIPAEAKTAADDFRQAGYRTAAFVSGFPLDRRFGFDRGFDAYDDHLPKGNDPRRTPYVERFADGTTDAALRWLAGPATGTSPFFLWVHYYDPHAPYEPPGPLGERFRGSPYDGEIAFVDSQLARLLGALDEKGQLARTLVLAAAGAVRPRRGCGGKDQPRGRAARSRRGAAAPAPGRPVDLGAAGGGGQRGPGDGGPAGRAGLRRRRPRAARRGCAAARRQGRREADAPHQPRHVGGAHRSAAGHP